MVDGLRSSLLRFGRSSGKNPLEPPHGGGSQSKISPYFVLVEAVANKSVKSQVRCGAELCHDQRVSCPNAKLHAISAGSTLFTLVH